MSKEVKNILIIGGCHVTNQVFINEIKNQTEYKIIRTIFTQFNDRSYEKKINFLSKNNETINSNYNVIIQLGNIHFKNSFFNLIQRTQEISNQFYSASISAYDNFSINKKGDKLSLTYILWILLKILIFPINIIYVPVKGIILFSDLKRILKKNLTCESIIIFTPLKTNNFINNIFESIGVAIIYTLFKKMKSVKIFDFYNLDYKKHHYKDENHLDENGIKMFTNAFIINALK